MLESLTLLVPWPQMHDAHIFVAGEDLVPEPPSAREARAGEQHAVERRRRRTEVPEHGATPRCSAAGERAVRRAEAWSSRHTPPDVARSSCGGGCSARAQLWCRAHDHVVAATGHASESGPHRAHLSHPGVGRVRLQTSLLSNLNNSCSGLSIQMQLL